MLFALYIIIAEAIILYVVLKGQGQGSEFWWDLLGGHLAGAFGVFAATILTTMIIDCSATKQVVQHEVHPIASLRTDSVVSGAFFLGCGGIGTNEEYYFMYDLGGGKYQRGTHPSYDVVLHETNQEYPNFSFDVVVETNRKMDLWWPNAFLFSNTQEANHILSVPKGTVIQKFEVK